MLRRSRPLLALLTAAFGIAATASAQTSFVPQTTALRHGLQHEWVTRIQLDRATDHVESVTPLLAISDRGPELRLFVQTRRGVLEALDGETGRRLWKVQVGNREHYTFAAAASDRFVVVVCGSVLYAYDQIDGTLVKEVKLEKTPNAPPGVGPEWAYIPTLPGQLSAYNLVDPRDRPWHASSSGQPYVQPLVTPRSVAWATTNGDLCVCALNDSDVRFRVETGREITAEAAYWAPHIYATSRDGYVYAVDEISGQVNWETSTGTPIDDAPTVIAGNVYVSIDGGGMFCFEGETGVELWFAPRVQDVVAVSPTRVYAFDNLGRTFVLDSKTGSIVDRLDTSMFNVRFANIHTDRLYYVSRHGVVQCLRERELVDAVLNSQPVLALPAAEGEAPVDGDAPADATVDPASEAAEDAMPLEGEEDPTNP